MEVVKAAAPHRSPKGVVIDPEPRADWRPRNQAPVEVAGAQAPGREGRPRAQAPTEARAHRASPLPGRFVAEAVQEVPCCPVSAQPVGRRAGARISSRPMPAVQAALVPAVWSARAGATPEPVDAGAPRPEKPTPDAAAWRSASQLPGAGGQSGRRMAATRSASAMARVLPARENHGRRRALATMMDIREACSITKHSGRKMMAWTQT